MSKTILCVAFHFPPFFGSSGIQRTLSFVRNLPRHGWHPVVLTVDPRVYRESRPDQLTDIPAGTRVERTWALDSSRDLALFGFHSKLLELPDRWWTWRWSAIRRGRELVRESRAQILWSTYPIATAHVIAAGIHRSTSIPWIADFRDPMIERDARTGQLHPPSRMLRNARARVERLAAKYAARLIFCTGGARKIFLDRHPHVDPARAVVIQNGFDEAIFASVLGARKAESKQDGPLHLVHSGIVYPGTDRDPTPILKGLRTLLDRHEIGSDEVRLTFRGSGHDVELAPLIRQYGLEGVVSLAPSIPYRAAIREMLEADALIVLQGYTSNPAIPAKLYEYLRARRPLFAMVDPEGETAKLLREIGVGSLASPDSVDEVTERLGTLLKALKGRQPVKVLTLQEASRFSRESQSDQLAKILADVARVGTNVAGAV